MGQRDDEGTVEEVREDATLSQSILVVGYGWLDDEDWREKAKSLGVYRLACPATPEDYAYVAERWARAVVAWLDRAQTHLDDCFGETLDAYGGGLPDREADDWQEAWRELCRFTKRIRPFLFDVEDLVEEYVGRRPRARIPTAGPCRLRGTYRGEPIDPLLEACRRGRRYFNRLRRWGRQLAAIVDMECYDCSLLMHHLGPPPDPPF